MTRVWSRRRPWPYHCDLDVGDGTGYHGLMLVLTEAGLLVGRSEEFLSNVTPTTQEYGAAPVAREATFRFGRLVGGMGERVQASADSRRYRYADGVDCSIGGMPRLGPLFTAESFPALPTAGEGVKQFIRANDGPNGEVLFALVGRTVYKRVAGVWTLSRDFGANNYPQQAVVFQGTAGNGGLWVTTAFGELWRYYQPAGWTQAVLPAPGATASCIEVVAHQLWVSNTTSVRVSNAGDPLLAASWGGEIKVGIPYNAPTYLRAVGDVLYVFKPEGIFTINADGSDNDLFPEMRARSMIANGKNATPWHDRLWFPYGDSLYRLGVGGDLEPIGPERLVENDSPVRGRPVSGAGHGDWFFYLGLYNAATGASHLMKFGTWLNPESGADPGSWRFAEVWNGAVASWASKRVTRVDVVQFDLDADPTDPGPALWVGFADGTAEWTPLPSATPDPALDSACRFRSAGQLYWPLHDAVFGADKKAFHGVTALGPTLNANQTARQYWRVDAGAYNQLSPDFTASGQRVELPDITTGAARDASTGLQLDAYTELRTTASTATPVLEGVAVHEAVRPSLRLQWSMVVDAGQRVARRDGVPARLTPEGVRSLLKVAAGAPGHVKLRLPDESVGAFAAVEYQEALAPDRGRDGNEWRIPVRLVQFR